MFLLWNPVSRQNSTFLNGTRNKRFEERWNCEILQTQVLVSKIPECLNEEAPLTRTELSSLSGPALRAAAPTPPAHCGWRCLMKHLWNVPAGSHSHHLHAGVRSCCEATLSGPQPMSTRVKRFGQQQQAAACPSADSQFSHRRSHQAEWNRK